MPTKAVLNAGTPNVVDMDMITGFLYSIVESGTMLSFKRDTTLPAHSYI